MVEEMRTVGGVKNVAYTDETLLKEKDDSSDSSLKMAYLDTDAESPLGSPLKIHDQNN